TCPQGPFDQLKRKLIVLDDCLKHALFLEQGRYFDRRAHDIGDKCEAGCIAAKRFRLKTRGGCLSRSASSAEEVEIVTYAYTGRVARYFSGGKTVETEGGGVDARTFGARGGIGARQQSAESGVTRCLCCI